MPSIGKEFIQQAFIAKRQSEVYLNRLQRSIRKLNKETHEQAITSYNTLADRLITRPGSLIYVSSMENLEALSGFMSNIDALGNAYRSQFQAVYNTHRFELVEGMKDKELRLMKVLKKIGIEDDRISVPQETVQIMNAVVQKMYKNINDMLLKWRSYVYDMFFHAITFEQHRNDLRSNFLTPDGNLKVGSSLEQMSESEAAIAAVEEKTAYLRAKAKENNYTYCWNVNPMDEITKKECIAATLAGVIPEKSMGDDYGFPPRYVCRCELAFVRKDWTELNQSINDELKDVRSRLIQELIEAPKQMSFWYVGRRKVVPADPVRAAGNKMYADIEEKLKFVEDLEVPDFEP